MAALKQAADSGIVVVAAIGLDRFDCLYNTIGHTLTIDLIREVAARLVDASPGVEIARLATNMLGTVWIARDADSARRAMLRLHQAMEAPIMLGARPVDVCVTIGLSEADADSARDVAIVDRATIAIEQGRRNRQPVARFDGRLHGDDAANLSLMSEMARAMDCGEISMRYQPKYDVEAAAIVGVEALVRWFHPQRGWLAPDAFVPMAEETGRIAALTAWVLKRAIEDQRRLNGRGHNLSFSVNLSGRLLDDEDFTRLALHIARGSVGKIVLEVTETAIVGNPQIALQTLAAFQTAGIGIAIDDYGSGLSSLGYLKNIPADELKIDKVFVLNLAEDRTDEILVRSAIDLAHSLGMRVVAEGVETSGALATLALMGCDFVQGYLIAQPMSVGELENFLDERVVAPEPALLLTEAV